MLQAIDISAVMPTVLIIGKEPELQCDPILFQISQKSTFKINLHLET